MLANYSLKQSHFKEKDAIRYGFSELFSLKKADGPETNHQL